MRYLLFGNMQVYLAVPGFVGAIGGFCYHDGDDYLERFPGSIVEEANE